MTKRIDSDALGILTKSLGLTGAGSPVTELTDGIVDQTLDVAPIVRRSRTQADIGGVYTGVFLNEHAGSGTLTTSVFPYNVTVGSFAPYPVPMPPQFDIWLLSATVLRVGGTGTIGAGLAQITPTSQQGFGVDDGGAAAGLVSALQFLCWWDTALSSGASVFAALRLVGQPVAVFGRRIARGTELRFQSTASALSDWQCIVNLGVFPVALGQDGIV